LTEQPIAPAAPPTAAVPAPVPAPPAQPAPAEPDWKAIAEKAQADAESWKGHARDWETRARSNKQTFDEQLAAQRAEIAKALGLAPEEPDPEKIAAQLQAVQAEKASLARQNAVLLAAHTAGADAAALLDSRSFLASLDNVDPANPAAVLDAVKAAVAANPRYGLAAPQAAAPAPPPRQASTAGSFNAAPGTARQLGEADMKHMTGAEISKAMAQGLFRDYLNTPN
jgi:hypothetical protein